jgi:hypothetical protein
LISKKVTRTLIKMMLDIANPIAPVSDKSMSEMTEEEVN